MWEAWLYLAVSTVSFTTQTVVLLRIIGASLPARRGLLRTAICRVTVSVIYVGLGLAALRGIAATAVAAFAALLAIQILWQVNALLDSRLAVCLSSSRCGPRHAKKTRQRTEFLFLSAYIWAGAAHRMRHGHRKP